eukprot:TRINITY_DN839_c0_g1_i18.p1 TRINITY_DN839_c0_g1~~TRINITY_DN839_c0_g1_i18.p1  ORF type:complete len:1067 (-),score=201.10 TRINITY_DN839_c0_g1_i18:31-3231(-)
MVSSATLIQKRRLQLEGQGMTGATGFTSLSNSFGILCEYLKIEDLAVLLLVNKTVRRMVLQTDKLCHVVIDQDFLGEYRTKDILQGFACWNKLGVRSVNADRESLGMDTFQWILDTFCNLERLHVAQLRVSEIKKETQGTYPLRVLNISSRVLTAPLSNLFSLISRCTELRTLVLDVPKIPSPSDLESCSQLQWLDVSARLNTSQNKERLETLEEIASLPTLKAVYALGIGRLHRQPENPKIVYQDLHQILGNWAQVKPMLSVNATGLGLFMEHIICECPAGESPPLNVIKDLIYMGAPITPFKHTTDVWRPQYPRLPDTEDQIFWPFVSALRRSQFDVCNVLIENGLDIKTICPASVNWDEVDWDIPMLEYMRTHGVNLNARDSKGQTILMNDIRLQNCQLVDYLLKSTPIDLESREENAIHSFFRWFEDPRSGKRNADELESALKKILRSGKFSLHSRDRLGRTPLMAALEQSLFFDLVLRHSRDVIDDVDNQTETALLRYFRKFPKRYASEEKDGRPKKSQLIKQSNMMLEMSPDVNIASDRGDTCLMYAVAIKNFEKEFKENPQTSVYQKLINAGADVDAKAKDGWTPLLMASLYYTQAFVSDLLARGCDVNATDVNGITPLMASLIKKPKILIVNHLIAKGASINAKNCYGMTPLHIACHGRSIEVLRAILTNGGDVNATDDMGRTPLHIAMQNCIPGFIKELLDAGANINAQDDQGRIPLASSFRRRIGEQCSHQDGDSVHHRYPKVHCCYWKDSGSLVEDSESLGEDESSNYIYYFLENFSVDASIVDIHGASLLHHAIKWQHHEFTIVPHLKRLIEWGANVNAQDSDGNTFLHLLLTLTERYEGSRYRSIEALCEDSTLTRDFDLNLANNDGFTVLHLACQHNLDVVNLLTTSSWRIPPDPNQFTNLGDAAIHLLIKKCPRRYPPLSGFDVNLKHRRTGKTPLIMMVIKARDVLSYSTSSLTDRVVSGLQWLLKLPGIDLMCKDNSGRSAFDYGLEHCLTQIRLIPPRIEAEHSPSRESVERRFVPIRWTKLFDDKVEARRSRARLEECESYEESNSD